MAAPTSSELLARALEHAVNGVNSALNGVLAAFGDHTGESDVDQAVSRLRDALNRVKQSVAPQDVPAWIGPLDKAAKQYQFEASAEIRDKPKAGANLLNAIVANRIKVKPIVSGAHGSSTIDFDVLFEEYYSNGDLETLFDELITLVRRIIDSGEIESASIVETLETMVATLRANRNGSYLALRGSTYTAHFLWNLAVVYLEKLPLVSEIKEAVQRTDEKLSQADRLLEKPISAMNEATRSRLIEHNPRIKKLAEYQDQPGELIQQISLALPSPEEPDNTTDRVDAH